MQDPSDRTWGFAVRTAADASTDKIDGYLARYAGPTRLGGYLDQIADKLWYLSILKPLVENGEVEASAYELVRMRDIGTTAVRPIAQLLGLETDATMSGKWKMAAQATAAISSCSPIAHHYPEFPHLLHNVGSVLSVSSGLELIADYCNEIEDRYGAEPAARLIVATTTLLFPITEIY
jgi:phosphatidylglycerophosphate synthase